MEKKFNPFSISVTATKKAIEDRQKKITNQEQLERLCLDAEHRSKLLFDIGYAEGEIEFFKGERKAAAEKRLSELNKQLKQIDNAYSQKSIEQYFQLENELEALLQSLLVLERLEAQYAR